MTSELGVIGAGLLSIAAFAVAFRFSGLVARARAAIALVSTTLAVITEPSLDDDEKERVTQRAAIDLFKAFALITLTASLVLAAPGIVIWFSDVMGLARLQDVLDFLLSWEVLIGTSLLLLAALWLLRRG